MKKLFVTTLVLFIAWNFMAMMLPDQRGSSQNLWNGNLTTAESVLFDIDTLKDKTVVLGSSHAAGMEFEGNTLNLALAGLSVYDGHMVLSKRNDSPRKVWIEGNVVQRPPSEDFAKMFTLLSNGKKYFPGLRTKNQPVAVFERLYEWARPRLKALILNREVATEVPGAAPEQTVDENSLVELGREQAVPEEDLRVAIQRLKRLVVELADQGVAIAFFEMPQHHSICDSPHANSIREAIKTAFPDLPYLDHPDCADYVTSDGIHLTRSSIVKYQEYLQKQMKLTTGG